MQDAEVGEVGALPGISSLKAFRVLRITKIVKTLRLAPKLKLSAVSCCLPSAPCFLGGWMFWGQYGSRFVY